LKPLCHICLFHLEVAEFLHARTLEPTVLKVVPGR
jgi:hypothetical protein